MDFRYTGVTFEKLRILLFCCQMQVMTAEGSFDPVDKSGKQDDVPE
jgi:hypothetical protein